MVFGFCLLEHLPLLAIVLGVFSGGGKGHLLKRPRRHFPKMTHGNVDILLSYFWSQVCVFENGFCHVSLWPVHYLRLCLGYCFHTHEHISNDCRCRWNIPDLATSVLVISLHFFSHRNIGRESSYLLVQDYKSNPSVWAWYKATVTRAQSLLSLAVGPRQIQQSNACMWSRQFGTKFWSSIFWYCASMIDASKK